MLFSRPRNVAQLRLGYCLRCDPAVPMQRAILESSSYEDDAVATCLNLVPDDGVFVDIGANIGAFTCAFAARRPRFRGRIHAIEPVSGNFAALKANIRLNGLGRRVTLDRLALGEQPGELTMHIEPDGSSNNAVGDNMLAAHDRLAVAERNWRRETVPMTTLDEWVGRRAITRCDLIKIDVEGAEPMVFKGGMQFLARCRPAICGEFNPYWMGQSGWTMPDVIELLRPFGYRCYAPEEGRHIEVDAFDAPDDGTMPTWYLIPAGRDDLLRRLLAVPVSGSGGRADSPDQYTAPDHP